MPADGKLLPDEKVDLYLAMNPRFRCRIKNTFFAATEETMSFITNEPDCRERKDTMKNSDRVKRLTVCALLTAITVILSRFLSISTPIVKIGFEFAPIALAALLFGPAWGCAVGAFADFIGANLFPIGAYFPGFTLVAGLTGMTYGLLLHRDGALAKTALPFWSRALLAVLIVTVFLQLGLDTLWLSILLGKGYLALLPMRMIKCAIMIPVQMLTIHVLVSMSDRLTGSRASRA